MNTYRKGELILPLVLLSACANDRDTRVDKTKIDNAISRWIQHCNSFSTRVSSDLDEYAESEAFHELIKIGRPAIPNIFENWQSIKKSHELSKFEQPPWFLLLERITGNQLLSTEDKVKYLAAQGHSQLSAKELAQYCVCVELREQEWLAWWEREGKKEFGITDGDRKPSVQPKK